MESGVQITSAATYPRDGLAEISLGALMLAGALTFRLPASSWPVTNLAAALLIPVALGKALPMLKVRWTEPRIRGNLPDDYLPSDRWIAFGMVFPVVLFGAFLLHVAGTTRDGVESVMTWIAGAFGPTLAAGLVFVAFLSRILRCHVMSLIVLPVTVILPFAIGPTGDLREPVTFQLLMAGCLLLVSGVAAYLVFLCSHPALPELSR